MKVYVVRSERADGIGDINDEFVGWDLDTAKAKARQAESYLTKKEKANTRFSISTYEIREPETEDVREAFYKWAEEFPWLPDPADFIRHEEIFKEE